jgi:hypothetical protein
MIENGAHDLVSLVEEFDPPNEEVPDVEMALPKKKRKRRHNYSPSQGHISHCLCPSCVAGRPERAAEIEAKKAAPKKR